MPEFPKWVHDHIKYPEGVTSEGRVDVSFKISVDGGITDVKILSGADAKLNEEAIRVIESSGNGWVPAIKDGKKIPITMMIPVIFKKLQEWKSSHIRGKPSQPPAGKTNMSSTRPS